MLLRRGLMGLLLLVVTTAVAWLVVMMRVTGSRLMRGSRRSMWRRERSCSA
jgi:hypothetical protein